MKRVWMFALVLALAGCSTGMTPTQTTVTKTVFPSPSVESTGTPNAAPVDSYSDNGVYKVGDGPSGGLLHAIPPGRYTVTLSGIGPIGSWIRCSDVLCGLEYPANTIAIGNAMGANYSSVMDVAPTDVAINLFGVILTPVH